MMKTDYVIFDKRAVERLAADAARCKLIGQFFCGTINEPVVRWSSDGSIEVLTEYEQKT